MDIPTHIRSFVRRQSRMTQAQAQALDAHLPDYELKIDGQPIDFARLFGNNKPVILEIGFGSGESLLHQAQVQPEYNFLGIEIHRPGIGHLLHHMISQGVNNIRLCCGDAVEVLKEIPDQQLKGIQLFFPDPWQKKRHHKRRLLQPGFLDLIHPKLMDGGFMHCATDWDDYAKQMSEVLTADTRFNGGPISRPPYRIITRFESRAHEKGHVISEWVYFKAQA